MWLLRRVPAAGGIQVSAQETLVITMSWHCFLLILLLVCSRGLYNTGNHGTKYMAIQMSLFGTGKTYIARVEESATSNKTHDTCQGQKVICVKQPGYVVGMVYTLCVEPSLYSIHWPGLCLKLYPGRLLLTCRLPDFVRSFNIFSSRIGPMIWLGVLRGKLHVHVFTNILGALFGLVSNSTSWNIWKKVD
jgi:hypothetical protein